MQEKQSIILGELSFIRYENLIGTSLVAHWVRICLPVQGHRKPYRDFPGGPLGKNPPSSAGTQVPSVCVCVWTSRSQGCKFLLLGFTAGLGLPWCQLQPPQYLPCGSLRIPSNSQSLLIMDWSMNYN